MIVIDPRTGSGDLYRLILSRPGHPPTEMAQLEFGDAEILGGTNDKGEDVLVGVEVKQLSDVLNSIQSGRFAGHQLPGLRASYNVTWLVVQGGFHYDEDSGLLVRGKLRTPVSIGRRQWMYRDLDHWLMTMEIMAGVKVRQTHTRAETVQFILDLHSWWVDKAWTEHNSHLVVYQGPDEPGPVQITEPTRLQHVAADLPGVGFKKSREIIKKFKSVREMVEADVKEWQEIEGIGPGIAKQIVEFLHGAKTGG